MDSDTPGEFDGILLDFVTFFAQFALVFSQTNCRYLLSIGSMIGCGLGKQNNEL